MSSNACPMYSLDYSKLGDDFEIRRFYKRFSSVFQLIRNNTDLETEKQSAIKSSSLLYDVLLVEVRYLLNSHIIYLIRLSTRFCFWFFYFSRFSYFSRINNKS